MLPSGSFGDAYRISNPSLHYRYDAANMTHDYSGNWDFDGDGIADSLCFVGTGGFHLYYRLRIVLSTKKKRDEFSFIQSDFPVLSPDSELKDPKYRPSEMTHFAVFDHGRDGRPDLFIRVDDQVFAAEKRQLREKGIRTKNVLLKFRRGKTIFSDYISER